MTFTFSPQDHPIMVYARIEGPKGHTNVRLGLDTGAGTTLISESVLRMLGYSRTSALAESTIITASGREDVYKVALRGLTSLGHERRDFPVVAHTLPATIRVDGLLGVDFLRDHKLTIDFGRGTIDLVT